MNPLPDKTLNTVSVPDNFYKVFLTAQNYVRNYFSISQSDPEKGSIKFSGERYILVRAASMSIEFFDMMALLYKDRGEKEAKPPILSTGKMIFPRHTRIKHFF